MRIYHNIPALNAYNSLNATNSALTKTIKKLSTGLRINSASDDAAGLAISERMRAQTAGLNQAIENSQNGISMLQTAEGALESTQSILQRMRELAVQAANDTLSSQDRSYIQLEIDELKSEIDQIANGTKFNGKRLLDGSSAGLWSSDKLSTKAYIRGSLIDTDQFNQKTSFEGNYKIQVDAEAGAAEVQKTNILTCEPVREEYYTVYRHGIMSGKLSSSPMKNQKMEIFIHGDKGDVYDSMTFSSSCGCCPDVYKEINNNHIVDRINAQLKEKGYNGTFVVDHKSGGREPHTVTLAYYTTDQSEVGTFEIKSGATGGFVTGKSKTVEKIEVKGSEYKGGVFIESHMASTTANYSLSGISALDGKTIKFSVHGRSVNVTFSEANTANKDVFYDYLNEQLSEIGLGAEEMENQLVLVYISPSTEGGPVFALGDVNGTPFETLTRIDDPNYHADPTEKNPNYYIKETLAITDANRAALVGKTIELQNGNRYERITFTANDVVDNNTLCNVVSNAAAKIGLTATLNNDKIEFKFPLPLNTIKVTGDITGTFFDTSNLQKWVSGDGLEFGFQGVEPSRVEETIELTRDTALSNVHQFYTSEGNYLLKDPKTITITQGDGQRTSVTLYETDTVGDMVDKLNKAIATDLGQASKVSSGADKFVTLVEEKTKAMFGLETVPGTLIVRSAIAGAAGQLRFSGDEDFLKALGLNTIQEARENTLTTTISDAHTGTLLRNATQVQVAGNKLIGVIHENVDVEFDPMVDIKAVWNEQTRSFDLSADDSVYTTILHLAENSMVLQTGANEGEDLALSIGNMSARSLGISGVLVTDRESASRSISILDNAITKVSSQRSKIGAYQNRLEYKIANLTTTYTNVSEAESRIRDADMAKEMMNFVKLQILNQSGTAMLAQANQLPQSVLSLLG